MSKLVIIGLLIVKNEEDILEDTILWYKSQGLDGLIVCDTGSTDKTIEIINDYKNKFVLDFIEKEKFLQSKITLELANLAYKKYKVDWIFPLDADEFFYPKNDLLNLRDIVSFFEEGSFFNVYVPRKRYYPTELDLNTSIITDKFHFYTLQSNWKAIARYNNPMVFEPGNHQIFNSYDRYPLTEDNHFLEVRHYEIRSYQQLLTNYKE